MERTTYDKNEVKKDLYKSKAVAKFSYYQSGNLYYSVEVLDGLYQFPIPTMDIEITETEVTTGEGDDVKVEKVEVKTYTPSADLGITPFGSEVKASELNRWIGKAIDKNEFIKVG